MRITFSIGFKADKAVCPYPAHGGNQLSQGRADLTFWAAKIIGTDDQYGIERQFLSKTYPLRYAKRPPPAFDAADLRAGDIIEVRCAESRSSESDKFFQVEDIDDTGMTLRELNDAELVAALKRLDDARAKPSH